MWNIQHMPFEVAGLHYYNDFFGRVCLVQPGPKPQALFLKPMKTEY